MTFSFTFIRRWQAGDTYVTIGTFTNNAGSTGGDIDTRLRTCRNMILTYTGSAVKPNHPVVNEDMPCDGRAVTIVTDTDASGLWYAWGDGMQ